MYSIFHQASDDAHEQYTDQTRMQSHGLDGAVDPARDNPFALAQNNTRNVIVSDKPQTHESVCSTAQPPHTSQPTAEHAVNVDFDLNHDRRKRRKLSQDDGLETIGHDVDVKHSVNPLSAEDSQTDSIFHSNTNSDAVSKDTALTDNPTKCTNTGKGVPKTRTPRKKRAQADVKSIESTEQQSKTEQKEEVTPSKRKRTTPKKKTLSVHTNGKLLSSPTKDPPPPVKVQAADNKSQSTKNFKMRNGKFVQSLEIVLRYGSDETSRDDVGRKIDCVLSRPSKSGQTIDQIAGPKPHPFFLGKVKPKAQTDEQPSNQGDHTDNETTSRRTEPVAWKDIKFSATQKPTVLRSADSIQPIWPPLSLQHIGCQLPILSQPVSIGDSPSKAKMKTRLTLLAQDEDILQEFSHRLKSGVPSSESIGTPQRRYLTGTQVASKLGVSLSTRYTHDAISSVCSTLVSRPSAFDQGVCAGPHMWPLQYAPRSHSEVLQPAASTLHRWLQGLVIHNVKSGIDTNDNLKKFKGPAKKKRRKIKDEIDDFIVPSDEEDEINKVKNAIMITGPNGCGKTASVYAVAKELGFEVFEIHAGMRRSAKDIFDKVGDMAHNHLVRNGSEISRASSMAPSDIDTSIDTDTDNQKTSVARFLAPKKLKKVAATVVAPPPQRNKREQKQSLILFEEVDLLFDDDRGFWNGVQALIKNSKRPVVLTCNDSSSVPIHELNLFDTLSYAPVDQELATDYLRYVAAAEGHIIDRETMSNLYHSKSWDLRASLTELNLWCQMTVGSKQGGLDWMAQKLTGKANPDGDGKPIRTFSQGTYQKSLDILPQISHDVEAAIKFNQESLGIDALEWCDFTREGSISGFDDCSTTLQALSKLSDIAEARSAIDVLDDYTAPALASATAVLLGTSDQVCDRNVVGQLYQHKPTADTMSRWTFVKALEPIMVEKPTFPPSQGRLAPSIDTAAPSIATELAPYVRCIVGFDKRLEQQRDEIFGSQGKARKTRAARAAAEGGDKASTRSERWFPKDLDFDQVLRTGGEWPVWCVEYSNEVGSPLGGTPEAAYTSSQ